jgi:hypothetical protein
MGPFQGQGQQQDSQISPSIYQPQQQPFLICDLYPYPYKSIDSSTTISILLSNNISDLSKGKSNPQ